MAPTVGLEEAICQTSVLSLHQREWLQGSFVRCFAANPPALIAVSPLGPQSQQHVAVQKPLEGSRKCQQKKKMGRRFFVIQKQTVVKDSRVNGKNVKVCLLSGGVSHLDVSELSVRFLLSPTAKQPVLV